MFTLLARPSIPGAILLAMVLGLAPSANAGTTTFEVAPSVVTTNYQPAPMIFFGGEFIQLPAVASTSIVDPAPPPFSIDFNALGVETVRVEFSAPPGQEFLVEPPTGWAPRKLRFEWAGGSSGNLAGAHSDPAPTVSFRNPIGTLPALTGASASWSGPGGTFFSFGASFDLLPGQTFSFEGLTIETEAPAGQAGQFFTPPFSIQGIRSSLKAQDTATIPPDPGAWIRIVPRCGCWHGGGPFVAAPWCFAPGNTLFGFAPGIFAQTVSLGAVSYCRVNGSIQWTTPDEHQACVASLEEACWGP